MTIQDPHELIAAYALDALTADERRTFEVHLRECEECRDDLRSLQETVGVLAASSEGPAPPAGLRDRIVAAAREERPNVVALRPRRLRLYAGSAAAAAACAALAIGLWLGLSNGSSGPKLALSVRTSRAAELVPSGFRPAPAGKVYEVWVIVAKKPPQPAGVFTENGTSVSLTRPVPAGATVAVTLEQAPGAKTPTPPVLAPTKVSV